MKVQILHGSAQIRGRTYREGDIVDVSDSEFASIQLATTVDAEPVVEVDVEVVDDGGDDGDEPKRGRGRRKK